MSLPEGWREMTLGEVVEKIIDYRGKTPKKLGSDWSLDGEYRALSAKSVKTGGLVNLEQINRVDEDLYQKWMKDEIQRNDILMTSEAPMGEILLWNSDEKIVLSQRLFAIRTINKVFPTYMYYYFISKNYQYELNARASGTTVVGIKQTELIKTKVVFPPLKEQKAIANILSSFDEKIELLKEQNETLEQMAQGVFRKWFVDEVDESWEVGVLSDEFKITMGQSPKGDTYNENDDGMVFYQGRAEFQNRFPKKRLCTTEPKRLAEKFDVLMSVRAPVGDINVASEQCCIGRGLSAINSEYKSYMLYKMKSLKKQFDMFESEGTVFGSISKTSLENLEVIIPPIELVEKYNLFAVPIDSKIYNNTIQIQTLQKTRDTLLPKLMSGEARVL